MAHVCLSVMVNDKVAVSGITIPQHIHRFFVLRTIKILCTSCYETFNWFLPATVNLHCSSTAIPLPSTMIHIQQLLDPLCSVGISMRVTSLVSNAGKDVAKKSDTLCVMASFCQLHVL